MTKRVVALFPAFEALESIEQLRRLFDPLASCVGAHITLVPPFESDISSDELSRHIRQATRTIQPFYILLRGVTGHESEYLFLNVKRGNDQLIELRDTLYSGLLASHLLPQYTYVPHLTLGRLPDKESFSHALETARKLQTSFDARISQISVYSIRSDGSRPIELTVSLGEGNG